MLESLPATKRFPSVQNAAIKDNIEPRLLFGWNSAKYDQITGPLPPRLQVQETFSTKLHLVLDQ